MYVFEITIVIMFHYVYMCVVYNYSKYITSIPPPPPPHTHTPSHTYHHHQMVRLYKDKHGGISQDSDREGTHLAHTALGPPPSHTAPVVESCEGLRRRIRDLEATLKQREVCLPMHTHIH